MKRRAKPILASAAIALSLTGCGWMGMGGDEARPSAGASVSQRDTRMPLYGQMVGKDQETPASQQYPQASQAMSPQMVSQIQRQLGQRGYNPGPVDGVFGESTQSALQNFQRDQGMQATGSVNQQTLAALGVTGGQQQMSGRQQSGAQQQEYSPTSRRGAMMQQQGRGQQQSLSPAMVRDMQAQLDQRGYEVGPIDGIWGPRTRQALTAFQRDENLGASGRVDSQTLAALGMDQAGPQVGEVPAEQQPMEPPQPQETQLERQQRLQQEQMGTIPQDEADIGPREQTGQVPGGETGGTDLPQEPGTLPDTGSEAPGSEQESERSGGIQGNEPAAETPKGGTQGTPQ